MSLLTTLYMTSARREPDNSPLLLHGILMEAREGTGLSCKRKKEAADKTHKLQGEGKRKRIRETRR